MTLRERNRFFGLSGKWSSIKLRALNRQIVTLSRVVIHPTYRGAGLAAAFIRRSCETCRWPWIEALAQMGHVHPLFEKSGFLRVGVTENKSQSIEKHSVIYRRPNTRDGKKKQLVTKETHDKSRFAEPVYYVFDNRGNWKRFRYDEERPLELGVHG